MRRPPSYPLAVRARALRLAGLAEVNRLKYELTMLAVGPAAPVAVIEEGEKTVRIENVAMRAMVFGNGERTAA